MADSGDMIAAIRARWHRRLENASFRQRYEAWLSDPTTQEVLEVSRESLYRPALPMNLLSGDNAIFAQGFSEGVWTHDECLRGIRAAVEQKSLPEPDYQGEDMKQETTERKEE